jgi:hypothetical protein
MSISKIPSLVAMPINKTVNQLYFTTSDERPVDMKASYVELEMSLDTTDNYNVVLAHDGLMYPPSCIFRSAKLTKTQTGEVVQDLNYVNVLDANMRHYSVGVNQVSADAIYSGAGHVTPQGTVVSIFNNDYPDQNPVLRVPLESLYPGSLGQSPVVPMGSGDVEFRFLLEPQYPVLMRAVPSGVYDQGTAGVSAPYAFDNVNSTGTTLTASALGTIANFTSNDFVIIKGTIGGGGGADYWVRQVGVVTADVGATEGNFTFTPALSATQAVSGITVQKITSNTYVLGARAIETTTNILTLNTSYSATKDLRVGTNVKVHYDVVTASGGDIVPVVLSTTIATVSGTPITSVTLAANITLSSNQVAYNIWIEPLFTNLDSNNWSVVSAHLVLYRRNLKVKAQKMLVQNFESVNVQCVGGLNRFMYNYKVRPNTFNAWAIQPTNTNLYGVRQGIAQYLFSLDERPLTSVYIDTNPLSAVHQDNVMRCGSNSPVYKIKNLRGNRDTDINSVIEPIMFPAKLFSAMINGEDNVQPEGMDKNLRIELVPTSVTEPCNVFLFMEKHQEI